MDTYEDFIGKFTDSDFIKASKYTREVIFGKLNPKRHITAEKFFINKIYQDIIGQYPELKDKTVSLATGQQLQTHSCSPALSCHDLQAVQRPAPERD